MNKLDIGSVKIFIIIQTIIKKISGLETQSIAKVILANKINLKQGQIRFSCVFFKFVRGLRKELYESIES